MAVFVNKNNATKYLASNEIAEVLRSIAKAVHPDLTKEELKKFSSHSGRVWALVLLDEAGMTPDFMKSRLRWMGESYCLYLRDTLILQRKHVDALKKESDEITRLLGNNREISSRTSSQLTMKWELTIFIRLLFPTIFVNFFLFLFFFACLRHIMALSYETKLHYPSSFFRDLCSREACMPT
jgi:hypothetical protein